MKKFRVMADFEFEAEDLNDAFDKFIDHFKKLKNCDDTNLIASGYFNISTIEE